VRERGVGRRAEHAVHQTARRRCALSHHGARDCFTLAIARVRKAKKGYGDKHGAFPLCEICKAVAATADDAEVEGLEKDSKPRGSDPFAGQTLLARYLGHERTIVISAAISAPAK
jgi:hypothetical protein